MLTIGSLVEGLGLELATGQAASATPVRWVHITELPDPTPWLSGGELLLTTGLQMTDEESQRDFVRRLEKHGLAGLGFGVGFTHSEIPEPLLDEAGKLGFPIFEVPYEVPFIALTERAMTRLVNEQYEVLQRGIAIHKRLERLVLEENGLDALVQAVAEAIGGAAAVLGGRGERMATGKTFREFPAAALDAIAADVAGRTAVTFAPEHPDVSGRALALPIATGAGPAAWLVAVRDGGPLGAFERLLLQQAVTVVALELMRQRVMRDTERRLAGDVFAEALTGRLEQAEIETRLAPFGVGAQAVVMVFGGLADPGGAEHMLERILRDSPAAGGLVATRPPFLCAVVSAGDLDPVDLASSARGQLAEAFGQVRAAVSRPTQLAQLRRAFHEARCALEAMSIYSNGNGDITKVASYRDLGAFQLLLSLQDDEALRLYCDSLLGPLENGGGEYGDELLRSLEAFIEQNGQWERAARELYCHRHTLRYRIRRIEELTGRDLGRARDRIEFWLALRARELIR
jgi:PucR family transcriptional regulator, purine catabolism regulatory protein